MTTKTATDNLPQPTADPQPQEPAEQAVAEAGSEPVQQHSPDPDLQLREIRELLFGAQVRQVNSDITSRHQKVNDQISALTQQMENSFAKLTRDFNNKLDDLNKHLEDLNRQHINREDDLAADLDDLRQNLAQAKLAAEQTDGAIRNELHSEAERLTRELEQRHNEAITRINQTSAELANNKTDRKTLAALLENMASNLAAGEQV